MPPTDSNSAQPKDAKEKQELSPPAGAHVCLYCGGKIPLLARWRGLRDFCSDQHQQLYWGETQRLAADAIRRQIRSRRALPGPEEPSAEGPPEPVLEVPAHEDLSLQPVEEALEEALEEGNDEAHDPEVVSSSEEDADAGLPAGNFRLEAAVLLEVPLPDAVDVGLEPRRPEPAPRTASKGGTEVEIPKTDFDPTVADVSPAPNQAWLTPLPPQDLAALAAATVHAIEPSPIDNDDLGALSSRLHYPLSKAAPGAEASWLAEELEIRLEPVHGSANLAPGYSVEDSNPAREPESQSLFARRSAAAVVPPTWFPQQEMVPVFREILSSEHSIVRSRPGMQAAEQMVRCILPVGVNESEEPRELNSAEARSAARTPMGGPATCRFELVNHIVQQRTLRLRRAGIRQLGTYVPQMRLRTLRPRLVRRPWEGTEAGSSVVKVSEESALSIRADG